MTPFILVSKKNRKTEKVYTFKFNLILIINSMYLV